MTCYTKQRGVWLPIVMLAGIGLLFAAVTPAQAAFIPLAQHNGAVDPVSAGWQLYQVGNPVDTQFSGPVYNDNDTGLDAWYVYDTSSAANTFWNYRQVPTPQQVDYLKATGWTLKTVMRVPDEGGAPSAGAMASLRDGSKSWSMLFGLIGGDMAVELTGGQRYTLTGQDNDDYHEFALQYDPATATAQLYVDGVARLDPIAGVGTPLRDFYFGSNSSPALGRGHYFHVSLVPEPGAAVMLLAGGLALAGFRRRRRSI